MKEQRDGKQPAEPVKGRMMPRLEREQYESHKDFAGRLLCSMFEEVYAHTGRELPAEMYDRASDLVDELLDAVREEKRNGHL